VTTPLRRCPGVYLLATSREALGITGEVSRRVASLGLPDAHMSTTADLLNQSEAVQLLVDRARAVQPRPSWKRGPASGT